MQRWQGLDDVPGRLGQVGRHHRRLRRRAPRSPARSSRRAAGLAARAGAAGRRRDLRPASGRGRAAGLASAVPVAPPGGAAELLAGLGVDAVCVLPFTLEFSRLGPDEFVQAVLVDRLHAARVVVGEDFRFGHRAAGDVALLGELGEKYDFTAEGVPLLADDGRDDLLHRDQGPARRRGRRGRRPRPRPPAPGRGRRGARPPARPGARLPHREPGDAAAYRHPGRRRLRGLAGQPGHRAAARASAGPRRSRSARTRPSTGRSAPSRPTRWTATTSTCTARTSRWTSPPGSAAWSGSTRSPTSSPRCTGTSTRPASSRPAAWYRNCWPEVTGSFQPCPYVADHSPTPGRRRKAAAAQARHPDSGALDDELTTMTMSNEAPAGYARGGSCSGRSDQQSAGAS